MAVVFEKLGMIMVQSGGGLAKYIVGLTELWIDCLISIFRERHKGGSSLLNVVIVQTYFTGVQAILLVAVMALMIGVLVTIQSFTLLASVGFSDLFGDIMVLGVIRELGPLITAFIVICRTGAGLATYVGNMKVGGEIDALEIMGINPIHYLIMPAILGCIISLFCLTLLFDGIAVIGGLGVSHIFGVQISLAMFLEQLYCTLTPADFLVTILKCVIFGSIVATVSCYQALTVGISISEVPPKTINAVVHSIVFVTIFNLLISTSFYLFLVQ